MKFRALNAEFNGLIRTEFVSISPKCYSYNHQPLDEQRKTSKTSKHVNQTAVKNEISHEGYIFTVKTTAIVKKDVVSIRRVNHQL